MRLSHKPILKTIQQGGGGSPHLLYRQCESLGLASNAELRRVVNTRNILIMN